MSASQLKLRESNQLISYLHKEVSDAKLGRLPPSSFAHSMHSTRDGNGVGLGGSYGFRSEASFGASSDAGGFGSASMGEESARDALLFGDGNAPSKVC